MVGTTARAQLILSAVGETFEVIRPDLGLRLVAECMSYKPTMVAVFAESIDRFGNPSGIFKVSSAGKCGVTFSGRSCVAQPSGTLIVELSQHNEGYVAVYDTWKLVASNVLRGLNNMTFRLDGFFEIKQYVADARGNRYFLQNQAKLMYHPPTRGSDFLGWFDMDADPAWADGYVETSEGERPVTLFGAYGKELHSVSTPTWHNSGGWLKLLKRSKYDEISLPGQKLLWRKTTALDANPDYFYFSEFHIQLNEMTPEMEKSLPQTDSRFREDLRLFESGLVDAAEEARTRIETFQQKSYEQRIKAVPAKVRGSEGTADPWQALWFRQSVNPYTGEFDYWKFDDSYWVREWSNCPDLRFRKNCTN